MTKSVSIMIRVTPTTKKKIKTICVKRGKSYEQAMLEWAGLTKVIHNQPRHF